MRRLAEREIAQADATAAETNDGRDRTRALRARHDRLRCVLLAALPAEMASAAFVSRLERFFLNHPEVFDAAVLDDLTDHFTTKTSPRRSVGVSDRPTSPASRRRGRPAAAQSPLRSGRLSAVATAGRRYAARGLSPWASAVALRRRRVSMAMTCMMK